MSRRAKQGELTFEEKAQLAPLIPYYSNKREFVPPRLAHMVDVCGSCGSRHLAGKFESCLACGSPLLSHTP